MRKRISISRNDAARSEESAWLDLEKVAEVEVTSEDSARPIEGALVAGDSAGWRAGSSGEQTIRLLFDQPERLRRVQLLFTEDEAERQQEFVLSWSPGDSSPMREIVRQQYQFSPRGSVRELEDYKVELENVRVLELKIIPDRSGGPAHATLASLRVA